MKSVNTVFLVFLIALACASNRGDPLAPGGGGSLSPGAGRANLAVVESNQYEACQVFFEDIHQSYIKAIGGINIHSDISESVRIMGNHNGYALVRVISPDTSETESSAIPDVRVEYINYYSDTGKLFYTGTLKLSGEWRSVGGVQKLYRFILNGPVDVSGDFACQLSFESFQMALDPDGQVLDMLAAMAAGPTYSLPNSGTVVITSGSETVRFSPYLFDYGPG